MYHYLYSIQNQTVGAALAREYAYMHRGVALRVLSG